MDQGLIPSRYAKALYKTARERGVAERLYSLMQTLRRSFAEQPTMQNVMSNPFVSFDDKKAIIDTAARAKADDTTFADFLVLLNRNKRVPMIRDIAQAYINIYRQYRHIFPVEVVTAAPMPEEQLDRIRKFVQERVGKDATVEYTTRIDPDLIGGFVVNVDSQRLDASVANQLKQLRLNLLSH